MKTVASHQSVQGSTATRLIKPHYRRQRVKDLETHDGIEESVRLFDDVTTQV